MLNGKSEFVGIVKTDKAIYMGIVIGLFPDTVMAKREGFCEGSSVSNDFPELKIKFTGWAICNSFLAAM